MMLPQKLETCIQKMAMRHLRCSQTISFSNIDISDAEIMIPTTSFLSNKEVRERL